MPKTNGNLIKNLFKVELFLIFIISTVLIKLMCIFSCRSGNQAYSDSIRVSGPHLYCIYQSTANSLSLKFFIYGDSHNIFHVGKI